MGANAQTEVPTFTAGEVLTAADMNISARTGIPVFADATARDAAFGGAGEKTLAEGQFAYLEDTNMPQVYQGSQWVNLLGSSAEVITSQTTTSVTFADLSTAGPSVTVTTGTSALVFLSAYAANTLSAGYTGFIGINVSGASTIAATEDRGARTAFYGNGTSINLAACVKITGLTAGSNVFKLQYKCDGSTIAFANRSIIVIPLT